MNRLTLTAGVLLCLLSAGLPFLFGSPEPAPSLKPSQRPDIVLVTIDALRADHLSLYGSARLTSPAIDRFARRSAVFTQAITQAPYTKAAIASLMSGLSPSAHKAVTASVPFAETMTGHLTSTPPSTDVLSPDILTLAEGLHAAGYRTLGFTANPFLIEPFGFAQGFDTFRFFPGGDFATADRVIDEALAAVEHAGPGPVFLWLHLMEPHSPYAPPTWAAGMLSIDGAPEPIPNEVAIPSWLVAGSPRDLRLYQARYDEEIAATDAAVDSFLRGFGELRDAGNTVTVLTADHGEQFMDHGGFEHSDTLYDELIHVPMIIHAPQGRRAVVDTQVQLLDLYRTVLGFGRADVPAAAEGRDLRPLLGGAQKPQPAYSEIHGALSAIRADGWKLIRWTDGRKALFDLRADPHERRDLAAADPARADSLEALLRQHDAAATERGRSITAHRSPVDPEQLERLRAVGYTAR